MLNLHLPPVFIFSFTKFFLLLPEEILETAKKFKKQLKQADDKIRFSLKENLKRFNEFLDIFEEYLEQRENLLNQLATVSFSIISCSSSTTKCIDSETKDLVIDIANDQLPKSGFGSIIDKLEMKVDNVRTIEHQKEIDRYTCKADFVVKNKENNQQNISPITYTV